MKPLPRLLESELPVARVLLNFPTIGDLAPLAATYAEAARRDCSTGCEDSAGQRDPTVRFASTACQTVSNWRAARQQSQVRVNLLRTRTHSRKRLGGAFP